MNSAVRAVQDGALGVVREKSKAEHQLMRRVGTEHRKDVSL